MSLIIKQEKINLRIEGPKTKKINLTVVHVGTQGLSGVDGSPGADGPPGIDGLPGVDGSDADATAAIELHRNDTTDVHGIPDIAQLLLDVEAGTQFSVKSYGAVGGNTGNQTPAIQAAIDAAAAAGGGVVFIPAGTYRVYGTISIPASGR